MRGIISIMRCAAKALGVGIVAIGCAAFVLAFTANPALARYTLFGVIAAAAISVVEGAGARLFPNWPWRGP